MKHHFEGKHTTEASLISVKIALVRATVYFTLILCAADATLTKKTDLY